MKFVQNANYFRVIGLIVAAVVFCLDVLSKNAAMLYLNALQPTVVTPFFNLVLTLNRGVSFSMFAAHNDYGVYGLIFVTLVIAVLVFYWLWTATNKVEVVSFGCILGGAFGNIFDRVSMGGVIDFLDFHIYGYHWPAFNVADSFICIGVFLLIAYQIHLKIQEKKGLSQ